MCSCNPGFFSLETLASSTESDRSDLLAIAQSCFHLVVSKDEICIVISSWLCQAFLSGEKRSSSQINLLGNFKQYTNPSVLQVLVDLLDSLNSPVSRNQHALHPSTPTNSLTSNKPWRKTSGHLLRHVPVKGFP